MLFLNQPTSTNMKEVYSEVQWEIKMIWKGQAADKAF